MRTKTIATVVKVTCKDDTCPYEISINCSNCKDCTFEELPSQEEEKELSRDDG